MIPVKCGTFTMWEHRVTLTEDFWLGKYEVTQNEYSSIMEQNPSNFWTSYNLPVENVTWDEAMAFCRKLTELERKNGILKKGYVYSLPTEAQWEYVWKSSANSTDSDSGWCANNSDNKTHEVGLKKANGWGFHDMNGNVREWCRDWYYKPIYMTDMTDPTGPVEGTFHVVRGTSFSDGMVEEPRRYYGSWGDARVGFRIALVPEKQAQ